MSNVNENPDGDQNPLDAIRENLARKIVEWDPEPGDSVVGYVTQIEYVETKDGAFPLLHFRRVAAHPRPRRRPAMSDQRNATEHHRQQAGPPPLTVERARRIVQLLDLGGQRGR